MHTKKTFEDYAVDIFAYVFLILLAFSTLLPFVNVFSKAVSAEWAVMSGKVGMYPVDFQLDTMGFVVMSKQFQNSFLISVFVAGVGTLVSVLLTAITAYPLSKRGLKGTKTVLLLYVFTMLFNGGMIPNYLLIKQLNLINNLWALILPGMINVFNMLVMKNYYESLPESLEESAKLDGASNMTVLVKIVMPLSTPVIATISLFYAVAFWNDFFSPMLYINRPSLKTLQLYLRDVVMEAARPASEKSVDDLMNISGESVRAATVIASTLPIVLVYPFVQKYFIKGIMIGSVKG